MVRVVIISCCAIAVDAASRSIAIKINFRKCMAGSFTSRLYAPDVRGTSFDVPFQDNCVVIQFGIIDVFTNVG